MSFMRNVFAVGRAFNDGAKVGKAYAFVSQHFHFQVTSRMIERTRPMLTQMADTCSVPELAIWYLSEYGRMVAAQADADELREASLQFARFVNEVKRLQETGERFGDYPMRFFCGAAEMCGADASSLKQA